MIPFIWKPVNIGSSRVKHLLICLSNIHLIKKVANANEIKSVNLNNNPVLKPFHPSAETN